jgi:hypothetical protein
MGAQISRQRPRVPPHIACQRAHNDASRAVRCLAMVTESQPRDVLDATTPAGRCTNYRETMSQRSARRYLASPRGLRSLRAHAIRDQSRNVRSSMRERDRACYGISP